MTTDNKANVTAEPKLTAEDRVAIMMSSESSRNLAAKYGVHHSRICAVRNEGKEILKQAFEERRVGRKPKAVPNGEIEKLKEENWMK